MPKFDLDIDNATALQGVNQVTQAVKALYQLLVQVKGVLGDVGLGGNGGAAAYFGGSTSTGAAAGSATAGGSVNLAGVFGGGGGAGGVGGLGLLLAQQGLNAQSNINPSIAQSQNQSVMQGLGFNPSRYNRSGELGSFSASEAHFEGVMGYTNRYNQQFRGSSYETFDDFRAARSQYSASADSAYQGGRLVDAFNSYADQTLNGSPVPGMSQRQYDHLGSLSAAAVASRTAQQTSYNQAAGSVALLGLSQAANAYTQGIVSGQPNNALAMGGAYGAGIGGMIGLVAGNAILPGIGGIAGAAIGASLGSAGAGVLQGPANARFQAAQTLGGYAAATGQDAMYLAGNAQDDASAYNNGRFASLNTRGSLRDFAEGNLRLWGLYQGTDQTSTQQMAQTQAAIGGGYLQNGTALSAGAISNMSRGMADRYGANAPAVAESIARAVGNLHTSGNNTTDLALRAGITPTVTFLRDRGDTAEADRLVGGMGVYQASQYRATGAASIAQGAAADYDATGYTGLSTRQRGGAYGAMAAAQQAQVGALDGELSALNAMPGGATSNEAKAKRALKSQLLSDIAREASNRASGVLNDAQGEGGVALSGANVALTRANLYGNAGSFAGAGREVLSALDGEASGITQAMQDSHLSYSDRLRGRSRLNEIASQRLMVPAQIAGSAMRRNLLGADVVAGQAGYGSSYAQAYGTDGDVGAATTRSLEAQQGIITAGVGALSNPNLSVEDRAAAQQRITSAQGAQLQLQIGGRDTLLSRMGGRAGVAQGAAGLALTKASVLGSGNDLRAASAGLVGAYGDESKQIDAQLAAGGLTVEQEIRLRGRKNSLGSEMFTTSQSAIDAGYAKDDLTGYTTPARKIQGQMERLQYLPFSTSNPIKLSLQQLGLNNKQLGVLSAREQALKSAGNLSPEREDEIEGQRQGLLTQNAAAVSQISEGFVNRLPGMSAGAPSYSGRLNSYSLAAAQLSAMGSPIRSFGAANGSALRTQDDFISQAGGDPGQIAARSTTSGLNSGGEQTALLRRIAEALEKSTGGGGGMRPGEATGNAYGQLSRRDTGQSYPSPSHN